MTEKVAEKKDNKKKNKPRKQASFENGLSNLKNLLASFEAKGSVHVNGHQYTHTSIITVDFGTPLEQQSLSDEEVNKLSDSLKLATKEVLGKDNTVRIHADKSNGIYWSSLV